MSQVRQVLPVIGSLAAITVTVIATILMVRAMPSGAARRAPVRVERASTAVATPARGVTVTLTAGDVVEMTRLPSLAFRLEPGESLDRRVPPGPWTGSFELAFTTGRVRAARVGVWIEGGSVIIRRRGELLLSAAPEAPGVVLTTTPITFGRGMERLSYEFRSDGTTTVALRAMWQPEDSRVPLPMPTDGARLLSDPATRGLHLAQVLGCGRCHASEDATLQAILEAAPAPHLGTIGDRARPAWIRRWLADPRAVHAHAIMPRVLHDPAADAGRLEDLTHFLVSLGGPADETDATPAAGTVASGRMLYHDVGCIACHGPLEPRSSLERGGDVDLRRTYRSLDGLAAKTTSAASLADFLEDPLAVRPDGRMPSMLLTGGEAKAVAAYLLSREPTPEAEPFALDPERVARGRVAFAEAGCASCHALGVGPQEIEARVPARPLESLVDASHDVGCWANPRDDGMPAYRLEPREREALSAFIDGLDAVRTYDVPHDRVAITMSRLQCTRCHSYHAEPGPEPGLEGYFATIGEADLGDEGRLPPNITEVGAKLNPAWLRRVLEDGARARPYLALRMPKFGADNAGHLVADLASAAAAPPRPDEGPEFDLAYATSGRKLTGSAGLNCIQCHDVAGRPATGTPGPDLAHVVERLRFANFARWLHDPAQVRTGTRMPSFFIAGRSSLREHFDGDADEQIRAIWCYLSQGELLPIPEGLTDPAGLALDVLDEPVVFRTFMRSAGVRAIAVGFPEQVHCAFDADRCRLVAAWRGPFLNAAGAWANRGGSETNPPQLVWQAPNEPEIRFGETPAGAVFDGYRLDDRRRPIFMYRVAADGVEVAVSEQPLPAQRDGEVMLVRRFGLRGPAGAELEIGTRTIRLDADGRATAELEVRW